MLCQLSYAPTGSALSVVGPFGARVAAVAASQRRALGALFLVLAVFFAGITAAAYTGGAWVIVVAGAVLTLWMGGLAIRTFRAAREETAR